MGKTKEELKEVNNENIAEKKDDKNEESNKRVNEERRKHERRKEDRRKELRRKDDVSIYEKMVVNLNEKIDSKNDELDTLRKEIDSLKDVMQRRQADFENYKKRSLKQAEDSKKLHIKDIASDIIMINDDLLRALEASSNISENEDCRPAHDSFVQGVTMISNRIEEALAKYNVNEIQALDCDFDPNFHEAVEIEMREDVTNDVVTKVHQKGFALDEFVIRSAKVRVAKPGKKAE